MKKSFLSVLSQFNILVLIMGAWISYLVINYFPIFGGDPEIHIIFAKNLLAGNWLQFNQGIYSSGETSPVYMLLIALYTILFSSYQQYFLKGISAFSLLGIMILIAVTAGKARFRNGLVWGMLFGCMCFVPFQSALGMENILFAFLTLLFIHYFCPQSISLKSFFCVVFIVPFLFYLRPEAVFLLLYIVVISTYFRNARLFVSAILAFSIIICIYIYINYITGVQLQSAGILRALTSKAEAYRLDVIGNLLYINIKPLKQLLYAVPFLIFLTFRRKALTFQDVALLVCFFCVPIVAHVFSFLPNTHYSRYSLYSYAVLFYVTSRILSVSLDLKIITAFVIYVISFSIVEFYVRSDLPRFTVFQSVEDLKISNIESFSNDLHMRLSSGGGKVTIALQEVQLRGRLDDRFIIWSLDGITDSSLANYVHDGYIDHFEYIKQRNIDYLQGPLFNYNSNKLFPSIADYKFDVFGYSQCIRGVSIYDIKYNNFYRVISCE